MNREVLERPFEDALLKTRQGHNGKSLTYVEGAEYIRRLNEAFEGQWSFEVTGYQVYSAEVMVIGKLTAGDVSKTAFGGSAITKSSRSKDPISLADDLKAAATDALKKAASMLGVGLDLYSSGERSESSEPSDSSQKGNGRRRRNVHRIDRLTQRQLAAIWSIARAHGVSSEEIQRRSKEMFGALPESLSKSDASDFITELQNSLPSSASV